MRRLVVSMFVSVDGYVNARGGEFIGPEWSPDLDAWTMEMVDRFDTLVYGRRSWLEMADYWPAAEASGTLSSPQQKLAAFMNAARKIVFSRTLPDAGAWANSTLERGDVAGVLRREKVAAGRDLVVFAGAGMVQSAMATGLVDEYWLLTIPMLFGGGTRLFGDSGAAAPLALTELRRMDTGAVLARYRNGGPGG